MRAIQITEFGGPEVLTLTELPDPVATGDLLVIDISHAGLNFADTHQAENFYLAPATLPLVPGAEAVGTTADGRRVVALLAGGGYAEKALAHPSSVFDVPDGVDDGTALSLVLQGMTAWHLLRTSSRMTAGESVVVHAAAGGVGTIAVQLAKLWGAGRVIATASSEDKRALALELGADAAVDSTEPELKAALLEANGGRKVDIVLEMAGGSVFDQSMAALAPFGRLVTYGLASRESPKPLQAAALMGTSRGVIGFWLVHCLAQPRMLTEAIDDLFALAQRGDVRAVVGGTYGFADVQQAHRDLRARTTTGKLLLDPSR